MNYDFFASPQEAYGIFGYGNRVGNGVAELDALARAFGENRAVILLGAAWQRHSDISGSTLTIGDAESYRGKYEDSVRFDGILFSGRDVSYALGWERTDVPDSVMHFGSLMAQLTASKTLNRRLIGEAHFFADSGMDVIGVGAAWTTRGMGDFRFGVAPDRDRGITGFYGYAFNSPRLRLAIDDRIWGTQGFDLDRREPPNYRQLRMTAEYKTSPSDTLRFAYGTQFQGAFSTRTVTLGYIERIEGAELHVDLGSSAAGRMHNAGLATYLSLPVGSGLALTEQSSLQGGASSANVQLKQNLRDDGIGTGYALNLGRSGTSFADASFTSGTSGSTTQIELSRFGAGGISWDAEFSGALIFVNGQRLALNQKIDQGSASDILKGRSAIALALVTETGQPLPVGSIVRALGESGNWRVEADGRVQIDDIAAGPQTLIVTLPYGTCVAGVAIPPNPNGTSDLGRQVCRRA